MIFTFGTGRRKKCDETKPHCRRCIDGGYLCLGYTHLQAIGMSSKGVSNGATTSTALIAKSQSKRFEEESLTLLLGLDSSHVSVLFPVDVHTQIVIASD